MIRVCFSSFYVENKYDKVEISNSQHHIIQVLTNNLGTFCSGWVSDSTIHVHMYSDGSVAYNGFTIDRIEAAYGVEVQSSFPGHWKEHQTAIKDENSNDVLYAGLHYNWHRFYDPEVGRYIRRDPLGMRAGHNAYTYVLNDTFNGVDLNGLYTSLHSPSGAAAMMAIARTAHHVAQATRMAAVAAARTCQMGSFTRLVTAAAQSRAASMAYLYGAVGFGLFHSDGELLRQIMVNLQREAMHSAPCVALQNLSDYAAHNGHAWASQALGVIALGCGLRGSKGTGPDKSKSVMRMSGDPGGGGKFITTPGGRELSGHAAKDSLVRHGFSPPFAQIDDIVDNYSRITKQLDGATVYIQRTAGRQRRYNIVILNEETNTVVTAMRNLTPHELRNLARNYGFTFAP